MGRSRRGHALAKSEVKTAPRSGTPNPPRDLRDKANNQTGNNGRTHFGKQPLDDAQIAAQREKAGGLVMARKAAIPMNRPYAEALTQPIEALNRQLVLGDLNQKQYEEELRSVMSIHGCPYENGLWRCRDHRSDNAGTTTVDDDE